MKDGWRDRLVPGILLGVGIGGFFDGIVLHQILQWHHMLSSTGDHPVTTVAGLETNTLWDGLFHAGTWIATIAGMVLLWQSMREDRGPQRSRTLVGSLLIGWGLFNLAEGLVNHQILGIHHVRSGGNELLWDLGFLAWGALMLAGGWLLAQPEREARLEAARSASASRLRENP